MRFFLQPAVFLFGRLSHQLLIVLVVIVYFAFRFLRNHDERLCYTSMMQAHG